MLPVHKLRPYSLNNTRKFSYACNKKRGNNNSKEVNTIMK